MRLAAKGTETENLFEILANKSPVGLCIIQDGKFCYTNPTFQSDTGYREDELLGRDSLEIVVPEDRERVRENAMKMLKGKLTLPYQFRVTHKDGSIHWVIESVASVKYRGRQATLGNFVDVTERKQMEEALQAEKNKLQSLIDTMEDHITIRDRDYNLIYMADHAKKLWGDRTGEKCYRVFEGQDKVCDGCPAEKAFKDGKSHTTERKTVTPSGEVIFWETRANPIRDVEGRIVACLELARNITERKQAEEALQAERNKLQSLIDALEYTITIQDTEYNIIYQNEPSRIASGGAHLGEKCYRAYEGRETVCDGCPLEKALKDGKSHTTERRTTIAGKVAFWENTANPIRDAEGRIVSCLELARDITKRKQADEALQAEKNKLQSLIDAMEYTLTIQDPEYNIIYQNEPSRIAFGDHLGEKCYRVYEGREGICEDCPVEKAFKDGKPHTAERKRVMPSGELSFWEYTANPIRDAEGRVVSCLALGRNITEHKQWEQALADEATRRRILVDQSLDGIVVLDVDARVYEANQRFADMLGYTLEEVRELHTWDWDKKFPPEKILEMGRNVDEKGLHLETQHTRKDGSAIDVDISINAAMCTGQKLIFCVCRDITARNQAQEALQAEKNKVQSVIDAMGDDLTIQDTEYNIIYQNEPAKRSSGGDRTGEKCYRVYEGRESICEDCPVEKAFKDGKPHTSERQQVLPSGELSFWENTANPIRDAKGEVVSCLEIGRNVTERKKQEQALADELTRRRLLVDQSLDGIAVLDGDAKVVEANQRFADMLGYTLEEVRELHTWDWDKKFPPEKILEMGRNVDEKGFHLETQHTRKDGSVIDVDISINAAMFGGQKLIFCVGRDVTERKRAEEALKTSEQSYRELADSITEVFFGMDEHLKYTYWNKASEILTGVQAEDAIGKSLLELFPDTPGTRRAKKVYRDVLRTQQSQTFVNDFDINGRHYTFEISAYPSRDGISVFVRDITERKKMEEAINLQRAYFQQLFDNSPDAILMMDTNDRAIQANRGFEVLFGYSNEEVKGRSLIELIVPEVDVQEASASLQRIVGGEVVRKESVRRRKDGSLVDVSVLAYPIRSNDKLVGAYGVYSDITERKQAEEAIKQAAEEWRRTFDSITDAISIHDRDFQILRANKAFADLFKKSPRQIIGKHCYELHKGNKPISVCPHQQTLATGKPAAAEFYESHLEKYLLESTSPIFNDKGEVVGTVHITRDITEQKQQNEQLMMADRLASIGELAAGTAHELNNPLTSVIGFSQLLMEKDIPDDIREDMEIIHNEARRAADVTKSLLTFARKRAPVKQLTQINNIIVDVLKLRAYEQKVNGIQVKRRLAHELPEIMVDNFQMQQVFLNIIINAEYFMTVAHTRGTLTINTKKHNGSMRISITDDGPGIPEENLSRIFDPFFTTKEAGKGTGLGLSICHGIVAEHGGQIYAKSQPGKGATFIVELPIKSPRPYRGTP
ncbi:MAG: PAS domain S-box protein [Dehalococcoidia bacterium]|nr:PAS domain S-box protein [Dehalococcoidia bacterium]